MWGGKGERVKAYCNSHEYVSIPLTHLGGQQSGEEYFRHDLRTLSRATILRLSHFLLHQVIDVGQLRRERTA